MQYTVNDLKVIIFQAYKDGATASRIESHESVEDLVDKFFEQNNHLILYINWAKENNEWRFK